VLFYASSSPTLIFNQAARQVAQQQWRSLSENAQALALINMAINDYVDMPYNSQLRVNTETEGRENG
jgi:hypothetical protein